MFWKAYVDLCECVGNSQKSESSAGNVVPSVNNETQIATRSVGRRIRATTASFASTTSCRCSRASATSWPTSRSPASVYRFRIPSVFESGWRLVSGRRRSRVVWESQRANTLWKTIVYVQIEVYLRTHETLEFPQEERTKRTSRPVGKKGGAPSRRLPHEHLSFPDTFHKLSLATRANSSPRERAAVCSRPRFSPASPASAGPFARERFKHEKGSNAARRAPPRRAGRVSAPSQAEVEVAQRATDS